MKKMIVMEDPAGCRKCMCLNGSGEACNAARRPFNDGIRVQIRNGENVKPIWCPLKDMPEYKMDWSDGNSYEAGWNDLLDVMGGRD